VLQRIWLRREIEATDARIDRLVSDLSCPCQ
jgi:hypothetical protein